MWGADDKIYFVGDPLPNEKDVEAGQPRGLQERQQHLQGPAPAAAQPVQVTKHTDGSLFFPSMSSDGKMIVYEENFGIWKLDVASGRTSEIKIDIATDEKENEVRRRDGAERSRRVRPLAVGSARGDFGARPDLHDRDQSRRHHAHRAGSRWRRAASRRSGRLTASTSRSSPTVRAATRSGCRIRTARA